MSKLTFRQRLAKISSKDPAEDVLPLLALGIFSVVGGAILISFAVNSSTFLVILGTVVAIVGAGVVTMALVLATLRRGTVSKTNDKNKSPDNNTTGNSYRPKR